MICTCPYCYGCRCCLCCCCSHCCLPHSSVPPIMLVQTSWYPSILPAPTHAHLCLPLLPTCPHCICGCSCGCCCCLPTSLSTPPPLSTFAAIAAAAAAHPTSFPPTCSCPPTCHLLPIVHHLSFTICRSSLFAICVHWPAPILMLHPYSPAPWLSVFDTLLVYIHIMIILLTIIT